MPEKTRSKSNAQPTSYLYFDGVDDYLDLGIADLLPDATAAYSISAWVLRKGDSIRTIIGNQRDSTTKGWTFKISSAAANKLESTFYNAAGSLRGWIGDATVPEGQWCHCVQTFDGNTKIFYIDGRANQKETLGVTVTVRLNNADNVRIGHRIAAGAGQEFFEGGLAKVGVWNRVLTASEVKKLFDNDIVPQNNLLGYWAMSDGFGSFVTDESSGGHNATIVGPIFQKTSDDFSDYASGFVLLDEMENATGWSVSGDATSVTLNTDYKKVGDASVDVNFTVSGTSAGAEKTLSSAKDISAMSKIGFWFYIADASQGVSITLNLESTPGNSAQFVYSDTIYDGSTYAEFDLASPTSTTGSLNLASVTKAEIIYTYGALEANTSFTVDSLYAYLDPNHTVGTWDYVNAPAILYGIVRPSTFNGKSELLVTPINRYDSGNHGRAIFNRERKASDSFELTFKVRKAIDGNGQGWFRMLWDFVDGHNYSGVYLAGGYNKVGIEQFIGNVRNNSEVSFNFVTGTQYEMKVICEGRHVQLFVDGVFMVEYTFTQPRLTGPFCIEAYNGSIDLYQLNSSTVGIQDIKVVSPLRKKT